MIQKIMQENIHYFNTNNYFYSALHFDFKNRFWNKIFYIALLSFLISVFFPSVSAAVKIAYYWEMDKRDQRSMNAEIRIWKMDLGLKNNFEVLNSKGDPVKVSIKKHTIPSKYLLYFQNNKGPIPSFSHLKLFIIKPRNQYSPGTYEVKVTSKPADKRVVNFIGRFRVSKSKDMTKPKKIRDLKVKVIREKALVRYHATTCEEIYKTDTFLKVSFRSPTRFSMIKWLPSESGSKKIIYRTSSGPSTDQKLLIPKQWFEDSKVGELKIQPVDGSGNVGRALTTPVNFKPMEKYLFWKNVLLYSGIIVLFMVVLIFFYRNVRTQNSAITNKTK